jgi:ABC-type nitrate/sulfonate/bicarbonate transport system ATPase subunit
MAVSPLLSVEGVGKTFLGRNSVEALRDVSLRIDSGEFVSIVGPSGSGKSTLFNLIAGLEMPSRGEIAVQGETDADERRSRCAYMFQKDLLLPWRNLLDNAALGLEVASRLSRGEARQRARELLPRFGLDGFEDYPPEKLSGGMRQRVALLRTLLLGRPLLLLDEPFASLDALTRRELQEWLRATWTLPGRSSEAALLVTHDVREAAYLSDRVYVMSPRPGTIVAEIDVPRSETGALEPTGLTRTEERILRALDVQVAM